MQSLGSENSEDTHPKQPLWWTGYAVSCRKLAAAPGWKLIFLSPWGKKNETVSTTWDKGDENRGAQPIRASTLTDGSQLLAAFQVNCSSINKQWKWGWRWLPHENFRTGPLFWHGLNETVWRIKMKISEKSTSKYLQSGASSAFTCLNIASGVNVGMSADQPEYYLEWNKQTNKQRLYNSVYD